MDVTEFFSYTLGVSKTDATGIGGRADGAGGRASEPVRRALPLRGPPQHAPPPGMNRHIYVYIYIHICINININKYIYIYIYIYIERERERERD